MSVCVVRGHAFHSGLKSKCLEPLSKVPNPYHLFNHCQIH